MTGDDLERRFLVAWREADRADQDRLKRLLAGILAGRVTLNVRQAREAAPEEVAALADALPADGLAEWVGRGRPS